MSIYMNELVPSGCMTYSKGPDQYPDNCPALLSHGKDCYVWDSFGNKYLDYGMGLRSVSIGYSNNYVNTAVIEELTKGNNLTLPTCLEYEVAKLFCEVTGFDMVKFAKNGSNVTSASIKLARAYTGKKYILACNQPFFSFDDWFIGSTVVKNGIPNEHYKYTLRFDYNNMSQIQEYVELYDIAAIILEPMTFEFPLTYDLEGNKNFLTELRLLCDVNNIVLIFDEMITGFRYGFPGFPTSIKPDLCCYGKAIANGFSVSALCGNKQIMKPSTLHTFLLSSTHGAEMTGLAALKATILFYQSHDVITHIKSFGKSLIEGANSIAYGLDISQCFRFYGHECSPYFETKDNNGTISLPFRTLFIQEMLKHNIIMAYVAISFSHNKDELETTLDAIYESLVVYRKALFEGIDKYLHSKVIKPVFRFYT